MKDQLQTIRRAVEMATPHYQADTERFKQALIALAQLEAMAGEPVAMLHDDGYWTPMKTEAGRALNDRLMRAGSISVDVYAAPVAQQPQAEPDIHEAQGQIEFLDKKNNALSAAIRKVMARLAYLLDEDQFKDIEETISSAGVQPQTEPTCNPHPKSPHGFNRSASHNEGRYVCDCEGWDAWGAGYSAGWQAGFDADAPQQPQTEDGLSKLRDMLQEAVDRLTAASQQDEAVPIHRECATFPPEERCKQCRPQQAEAVPANFVLVPVAVLEAASESLGSFVSDNGWTDADMQAMDNLDAILAQQKGQP